MEPSDFNPMVICRLKRSMASTRACGSSTSTPKTTASGKRSHCLAILQYCTMTDQYMSSHITAHCRTLEGSSLTCFTFLMELRLYDNKLKDLHGSLAILSKLRHLKDLDLFGNPLQEEENYRLQVIKAVPSLVVLDRHVITTEERAKAER